MDLIKMIVNPSFIVFCLIKMYDYNVYHYELFLTLANQRFALITTSQL